MGVSDKSGVIEMKGIFFIKKFIVYGNIHHIGKKHGVTAERFDLPHFTFNVDRAFRNTRCRNLLRGERCQMQFFEFVNIFSGADTAEIGRTD